MGSMTDCSPPSRRHDSLRHAFLLPLAVALFVGCDTPPAQEECDEQALGRCDGEHAIVCEVSGGLAAYSAQPLVEHCGSGARCELRYEDRDQVTQPYCILTPETACDPEQDPKWTCTSETEVEFCDEAQKVMVRYRCDENGVRLFLANGKTPCGANGRCTSL